MAELLIFDNFPRPFCSPCQSWVDQNKLNLDRTQSNHRRSVRIFQSCDIFLASTIQTAASFSGQCVGGVTWPSFETISLWRRSASRAVIALVTVVGAGPVLTQWLAEGREVNDHWSVVGHRVPRQRVSFIWPDTDIRCTCRCRHTDVGTHGNHALNSGMGSLGTGQVLFGMMNGTERRGRRRRTNDVRDWCNSDLHILSECTIATVATPDAYKQALWAFEAEQLMILMTMVPNHPQFYTPSWTTSQFLILSQYPMASLSACRFLDLPLLLYRRLHSTHASRCVHWKLQCMFLCNRNILLMTLVNPLTWVHADTPIISRFNYQFFFFFFWVCLRYLLA